MENKENKKSRIKGRREQGSVALEHILFIGAVVAMSAGIWIYYGNVGSFFSNFDVPGFASSGRSSE